VTWHSSSGSQGRSDSEESGIFASRDSFRGKGSVVRREGELTYCMISTYSGGLDRLLKWQAYKKPA